MDSGIDYSWIGERVIHIIQEQFTIYNNNNNNNLFTLICSTSHRTKEFL